MFHTKHLVARGSGEARRRAVDLHEFYQAKISECDSQILEQLKLFDAAESDMNPPDGKPPASLEEALLRMSGADLASIDGIDTTTALKIILGFELVTIQS